MICLFLYLNGRLSQVILMKKLLFLVPLISFTPHTLIRAHENTHTKKTAQQKNKRALQILLASLSCVLAFSYFSIEAQEEKNTFDSTIPLPFEPGFETATTIDDTDALRSRIDIENEPEVGLGTKINASIWSAYRFCWLTGHPMIFFAGLAETLVRLTGTSTEPDTLGDALTGIVAAIFFYFYIKKVSYPSAKRKYEEICSFRQSSDAAISDERTQPAPHHP